MASARRSVKLRVSRAYSFSRYRASRWARSSRLARGVNCRWAMRAAPRGATCATAWPSARTKERRVVRTPHRPPVPCPAGIVVVGTDTGGALAVGSTPPNRCAACELGTCGIMPVMGTGWDWRYLATSVTILLEVCAGGSCGCGISGGTLCTAWITGSSGISS